MASDTIPTDPRFKNLSGQKFGRWTVIDYAGRRSGRHAWKCKCACGGIKAIRACDLLNGHSRSCGCWMPELLRQVNTKHGMGSTRLPSPEYRAWRAMLSRCRNPRVSNYKDYGGRGVTVCRRWYVFENFLEDVGRRPSLQHSLDRKDNHGSYTCGKCGDCRSHGWPANWRWATQKQQMRNTRRNRVVSYAGRSMSVADWADEYSIPYRLLYNRIHKLKWPMNKAITTPVKEKCRWRTA